MRIMKSHPSETTIQANASVALAYMSISTEGHRKARAAGGLDAISAAIKRAGPSYVMECLSIGQQALARRPGPMELALR